MQLQHVPMTNSFLTRSPDLKLTAISIDDRVIQVVREDLLPGGTKERACTPYLQKQIQKGFSQFVYASPFAGFAQVALAASADVLKTKALIFCEKVPDKNRPEFHEFSKLAQSYGAEIRLCDSLQAAEMQAEEYRLQRNSVLKIPLGFDCDDFRDYLQIALNIQWNILENQISREPKRLWVSLGSGTLLKTLRKVVPLQIQICAVNVHVLSGSDLRIEASAQLQNVIIFSAPEEFREQSKFHPPITSNIHYDAKVWQFVSRHAGNDDIWWNVAR